MNDHITCPHCKKSFSPDEALSHQVTLKIEAEKSRMREAAQKWKEEQQKKLQDELADQQKLLQEKLKEQMKRQADLLLRDAKNESEELKKQNESFQEQILEMNKMMRQLKAQDQERQIQMEKKLVEEQEKIKDQVKKQVEDANHLKMLEMDKKLHDAIKVNEELKRKLEQGSQQMQGEVLELDLEDKLRREFPYDEIKPVAKGVQGADLVQVVKSPTGTKCGTIMWELKRTKAWSPQWIGKLKDDQRTINAEIAVIVSQVLPPDIVRFGGKDGVWVCEYDCIMGIAYVLRSSLIQLATAKMSSVGKNEKMEVLWSYLTSTEFTHRIETIVDAFSSLQDDIEKEKRWFSTKWAKQEKNIRKVMDSTLGMHGDLQSIVGKELSQIKGLEMLPEVIEGELKENEELFQ